MSKHTQGPWRLDDPIHAHVLGEDYHVIDAGIWHKGGFHIATFISEADAKLIAAAPELLAACLRTLEHPAVPLCECGQPDCATTLMRTAVERATR